MGVAPSCRELEELWRKRLQEEWVRYREAEEELRVTQLEYAEQIPFSDGRLAVHQAQSKVIWALKKYRCTLKVLYDLQFHDKISRPNE